MGYMGLDGVVESDMASDLASVVVESMTKVLKKGLKNKANGFNTSGPVNVALIFEEMILPCINQYQDSSKLFEVAELTVSGLEKLIKETKAWKNDEENKKFHLTAYKRMLKSMNKFLENAYG